jgi:MoaA/NifB/PqqE/SkfB family radical SAM enzyme
MCGQWGDHGITKKEGVQNLSSYLSEAEIRSVLNDVKGFKPNITLFGGEPFLHPNFYEIISQIKRLNMHCLVITNGTLLKCFAKRIVEAGLDELNISIDGDRNMHDEIRGLPGIFDQIMDGIAEVNKFKKELKKTAPLINLQCTISRYNYEKLEHLLGVARDALANSLTFHNLIFLKRELADKQRAFDLELGCSSKDWEGFIFEPGIDAKRLFEKLTDIKVRAKLERFAVDIFPNFSEKGIREYYENPDYLPSEYSAKCASPWICGYIFPDGEVRPCLNCSYSFGNINKAGFLDVWNSPEAIRYRRTLKKEGIFPACRRCTELYRY